MTNEAMLKLVSEIQEQGNFDWFKLLKIKKELEEDVLKDAARASGSSKSQQTAAKILKKCDREKLQKAWIEDGIQYFLDGYMGFALNKHLPLPLCEEKPFDISSMIQGAKRQNDKELSLPSQAEILGYVKVKKAEGQKNQFWDFGEGMPYVDAQRLYDMIAILPNASVSWHSPVNSLYFQAENGEGILMPARKPRVGQQEEV